MHAHGHAHAHVPLQKSVQHSGAVIQAYVSHSGVREPFTHLYASHAGIHATKCPLRTKRPLRVVPVAYKMPVACCTSSLLCTPDAESASRRRKCKPSQNYRASRRRTTVQAVRFVCVSCLRVFVLRGLFDYFRVLFQLALHTSHALSAFFQSEYWSTCQVTFEPCQVTARMVQAAAPARMVQAAARASRSDTCRKPRRFALSLDTPTESRARWPFCGLLHTGPRLHCPSTAFASCTLLALQLALQFLASRVVALALAHVVARVLAIVPQVLRP